MGCFKYLKIAWFLLKYIYILINEATFSNLYPPRSGQITKRRRRNKDMSRTHVIGSVLEQKNSLSLRMQVSGEQFLLVNNNSSGMPVGAAQSNFMNKGEL